MFFDDFDYAHDSFCIGESENYEIEMTKRNRRSKTSFFEDDDLTENQNEPLFNHELYKDKIIILISNKPNRDSEEYQSNNNDDPIIINDTNNNYTNDGDTNDKDKNDNTLHPRKRIRVIPPNPQFPLLPPQSPPTPSPTILPLPPQPPILPPLNPPSIIFSFVDLHNNRNRRSSDGNDDDDNDTSNNLLSQTQTVSTNMECKNPLCNHKTMEEDPTELEELNIPVIKSVDDLIKMGKSFHCKKRTTYRGLNLRIMCNLVAPLTELKDMIGMNDVKEHVVDQILFFLQGFNTSDKCNKCQDCVYGLPCVQSNTEMLHTVITGPPGVGKTCLGRIMGKVYKGMGILSTGQFHEVSRTDMVAGYLGQTAIKTQKLIDKCKGGVMFIDEAYSMGSKEKRDSFSKEALDTLNKNLSDKRDFLCIIAGYEKELEECFFSMNEGLKRRFTFRYNVKEYDYKELLDIFKLKVQKENWTIDFNADADKDDKKYTEQDLINLFKANKDRFPYSGGDIETYFLQCKIVHGRRMPTVKKCLSFMDLKKGLELFAKNRKSKKVQKDDEEEKRPSMYNFGD